MELSPELIISSILMPLIGGIVVYLVTQINRSGERMAEFSNKVSDAMSVIAQRVASEESNRANEDNLATLRSDFRVHDDKSSDARRRRRAPCTSCGCSWSGWRAPSRASASTAPRAEQVTVCTAPARLIGWHDTQRARMRGWRALPVFPGRLQAALFVSGASHDRPKPCCRAASATTIR